VTAVDAAAATRTVTTARGISCQVVVLGDTTSTVPPIVAFHGASGHLAGEPMLTKLAEHYAVYAPVWPGYGAEDGEELIEDMLDFALHGADVIDALGLGPAHGGPAPHLIGHSMGGMIAAEMVAISPVSYGKLALIAPAGLWLDEYPIVDIFTLLPFEFPQYLFHDADAGAAMMTGGMDFDDVDAIKAFLIGNSRRLGTAGKILFPIPNRRLSKRLYRVTNPALVLWGESDRLITPVYARAWLDKLPHAELAYIEAAGHMAPYEQPDDVATRIANFFA
jgi:pimeloyl-ACP methyl ester carboxylesterase